MIMDTQTVFKVALIIFILHLILQSFNSSAVIPEEFGGLTLNDTNEIQKSQTKLEMNIDNQADEDFINDLINSGVETGLVEQAKFEVAPAPSGAPSFDDLQFNKVQNAPAAYPNGLENTVSGGKYPISNYDLSKPSKECKVNKLVYQQHSESDLNLADVINNQINSQNDLSGVQPDNSVGDNYVSAQFGNTSITPFSRSHGMSTTEFYAKNKVSHFDSIPTSLAKFPSASALSGSFTKNSMSNKKMDLGLASIRNPKGSPVQVDSKIYNSNPNYSCGGVTGDLMAANAQDNFASLV